MNTKGEAVPHIDGVHELDVLDAVAEALGVIDTEEPRMSRWSRARQLATGIADKLGLSLEEPASKARDR